MYKRFLWVLALAFSFVLSQTTYADSWGCGKGMKEMVESLKLDDAEKVKIKPILDQLRSSMKENSAQMKVLEAQINEQVDSAKMDQATVDGLVDKKAQLIGNMMKAKITAKIQIFTVLNAEQKAELQNMMKKLEEEIKAQFKSCHKES